MSKKARTDEIRRTRDMRAWKERIAEKYGGRCAVCGSDWNVHIHHIVPIAFMPEYALTDNNGIALCAVCHNAAHGNIHWHPTGAEYGRPSLYKELTDERRDALRMWAENKIGTAEAKRLCGMNESTHITDCQFYKTWMQEEGQKLKHGRNGIDVSIGRIRAKSRKETNENAE